MNKRLLLLTGLLVVLSGAWAARVVYRAMHDLVTLDVESMPLRKVVSRLRRQTWEDIRVHKDLDGLVTLKVENAPLEAVLGVIAQQTGGRWTPAMPIFREKSSLKLFEKLMEGAVESPQPGWTNYTARMEFMFRPPTTNADGTVGFGGRGGFGGPGGPFGGPGGPGGEQPGLRSPVDAKLESASPEQAAAELRRAGRARVVAADHLGGKASLELSAVPLGQAVAQTASKYGAKTELYYLLETRRGGMPSPEQREQMRAAFAGGERPNFEEMRARMEERMNDPAMQDRMIQRSIQNLKNTTPEQRAEQARQRRERFGGRGGPGGPGGEPGGRGGR